MQFFAGCIAENLDALADSAEDSRKENNKEDRAERAAVMVERRHF